MVVATLAVAMPATISMKQTHHPHTLTVTSLLWWGISLEVPLKNSSLGYKALVLVVVVVPLLATALAIGLLWQRAVHWSDIILLASMYTLVAFGVTVGYHRMLTHRSFRA